MSTDLTNLAKVPFNDGSISDTLWNWLNKLFKWVRYKTFYNVKDYGAKGDGVTDDSNAIQATHDAMGSTGGTIYFPPGTYIVGTAITLSKACHVLGSGPYSSILKAGTTNDLLYFTGTYQSCANIGFDCTGTKTAGAYVRNGTASSRFVIDNCVMLNFFYGCYIESIASWHGSNLYILSASASGSRAFYLPSTGLGQDVVISRCIADSGSTAGAAGIRIDVCGELLIANSEFIRFQTGLNLRPASGKVIASFWANNSKFDSCTVRGGIFDLSDGGTIVRTKLSNCWFSSAAASDGLRIGGAGSAGSIDGVDITDCHFFLNAAYGINAGMAAGTTVKNIHIQGGEWAQNTNDGILIQNGITDFSIIGVRSGNTGGLTGNGGYGINISNAASTNYRVIGNDTRGNTTAGINDVGIAPKVVGLNL